MDGVHILHGSGNGYIHIRKVQSANSPMRAGGFKLDPRPVRAALFTGHGDVHHPKYATPDLTSMVFVSGRGTDAKLFYMPDVNNPQANIELKLSPGNRGAEIPSVSRPRPRY